MQDSSKMTNAEKEVMIHLAKHGAKASSKAISKLIKHNVSLDVKDVAYLAVEKIGGALLNSETVVTTLYLKITGDVAGSIVLVFPNECAYFLVDLLSDTKSEHPIMMFSEYEKSILKEISNIISGSFLKSLSDYLNLSVESIPDMTTDMAKAAMDSVLIDFAHSSEKAITIDMEITSEQKKIQGSFFLLFDSSSAEVILQSLAKRLENE